MSSFFHLRHPQFFRAEFVRTVVTLLRDDLASRNKTFRIDLNAEHLIFLQVVKVPRGVDELMSSSALFFRFSVIV